MINPNRIDIWHKINIIYKDKDFLIIEKPSGLIVHPHRFQKNNTLTDWILKKYPEIKKVGESSRPGLVHRLDKDVSGLMVIARNNATYQYLVEQFKNRKVKKEYLALVYKTISPAKGIINFSIARNKKGKLITIGSQNTSIITKAKNIKSAITEYKIIKKFRDFTLLRLKLLTGRTHQIRLHLKAMGCPIVGDERYAKIKNQKSKIKNRLTRIFLHACCLGFYNQQGKWLEFKSNLPKELKEFLV